MGYNSTTVPPEVAAALPPYLQAQIPFYDETTQPNLYAAMIICLFLAYLAVGLRFYAWRLKGQRLRWDDYMISLSLILNTIFIGLCLFQTASGVGRHEVVMVLEHPDRIVRFNKVLLITEILYSPCVACTKYAILMLYYRLFPGPVFKRVCVGMAVLITAYSIAAIFTNVFQCTPVESQWNGSVPDHCVNVNQELLFVATMNVISDAGILLMPIPLIWRLKTDTHRKIQLTFVMLLGSFVVVVSIVRATYLSSFSPIDGQWNDANTALWSVVETGMGIVAACLPVLRPVFNKVVYGSADRPDPDASAAGWKKQDIVTIGGSGQTRGSVLQMQGLKNEDAGHQRDSFTRLVYE